MEEEMFDIYIRRKYTPQYVYKYVRVEFMVVLVLRNKFS